MGAKAGYRLRRNWRWTATPLRLPSPRVACSLTLILTYIGAATIPRLVLVTRQRTLHPGRLKAWPMLQKRTARLGLSVYPAITFGRVTTALGSGRLGPRKSSSSCERVQTGKSAYQKTRCLAVVGFSRLGWCGDSGRFCALCSWRGARLYQRRPSSVRRCCCAIVSRCAY